MVCGLDVIVWIVFDGVVGVGDAVDVRCVELY